MTQPPRRRPASSRTAASRPRKIAGRTGPDVERDSPPDETPDDHGAPGDPEPEDAAGDPAPVADEGPAAADATDPEESTGRRFLASERLTVALLGVLALVLVAGIALSGMLAFQQFRGDDTAEAAEVPEGQIAVPDGRPVTIDELAWQEGVDAAAKAAQEIVAVNYEEYDAEVDAAAELMTDDFGETYRETAADVREQIIDRKTVVQASIAAQGVVRANETELQALIFLNQFVNREDEDGPTNVITPYKVLVTMVHTDNGWFVDSLDTDDQAPATGQQPPTEEPSSPAGEQSPPAEEQSPGTGE